MTLIFLCYSVLNLKGFDMDCMGDWKWYRGVSFNGQNVAWDLRIWELIGVRALGFVPLIWACWRWGETLDLSEICNFLVIVVKRVDIFLSKHFDGITSVIECLELVCYFSSKLLWICNMMIFGVKTHRKQLPSNQESTGFLKLYMFCYLLYMVNKLNYPLLLSGDWNTSYICFCTGGKRSDSSHASGYRDLREMVYATINSSA